MFDRSVEKQARRALRRMVFYRLVGDVLFHLPTAVLVGIDGLIQMLVRFFRRCEMSVFLLELDAARRYTLLTGNDLGTASGEPGRYGLMNHPELAADSQQAFIEQRLAEAEEE